MIGVVVGLSDLRSSVPGLLLKTISVVFLKWSSSLIEVRVLHMSGRSSRFPDDRADEGNAMKGQ